MNYQQLDVAGLAGNATEVWTPNSNQAYKVLFGHAIMVADGTAANRYLILTLKDVAGNIVSDTHSGSPVTAGQTRQFSMKPGIFRETSFIDTDIEYPLAIGLIVPPGFTLTLSTDNGQAGDTIEAHIGVSVGLLSSF